MSITVYIDYGIEIVTESLDFYYADMSEVLVWLNLLSIL